MFLADYHVHTSYSFDHDPTQDCSPRALVERALENGLSEIAFTDHYCVNFVLSGDHPDIDFAARKTEIDHLKDEFAGRIRILCGVELGQPAQRDAEAKALLANNAFDFVIGSLHNVSGEPDFYFIDFKELDRARINDFWDRYLRESIEHIRWGKGRFHSMGHLNYPLRYLWRDQLLAKVDLASREEVYREVFRELIAAGIALEINTSGVFRGMGETSPSFDFCRLYREVGGKLFTVGSDAHAPDAIGAHIKETYLFLQSLGVDSVATFDAGSLVMKSVL